MSALRYFAEEATLSLWRRRGTNILSLVTIATAMFVLGLFLVVNANVQRVLARWTEAAALAIYLTDAHTAADREAVVREVSASGVAEGHTLVSREEALRRFARTFPELAASAADLGDQALPASVEVRLRSDADPARLEELAARVERLAGVADVRYDRRWIERLTRVIRVGRTAGVALAALLVLAAGLTVVSVVKLALYARQQEIEIMQLVGAPLSYIRGPFVVEGVFQGGLGALLALGALAAGWLALRARAGAVELLPGGADDITLAFLPWTWAAGLIVGGMLVGCVAGLVAARSAR